MVELRILGSTDLRTTDGRVLHSVLSQPKRLAILAYLALAPTRPFCRRDLLLPLFWPDIDQEHARAALRKSIHFLRQSLGAEAIVGRGDEEIGLSESVVWCDAAAFERALVERRHEEALSLYRGDLLDGFHVTEAPAFADWLDRQRGRLRREAAELASRLAATEAAAKGIAAAIPWARRAAELAVDDEAVFCQLITLLDRAGDRAGALRAYGAFARHLADEYEVEPSAETRALIASIRARESASEAARAPGVESAPAAERESAGVVAVPVATPSGGAPAPPAGMSRGRMLLFGTIGAALLLTTVMVAQSATKLSARAAPPVLAVGEIRDFSGAPASSVEALPEILSSALANVRGLQVVSRMRVFELAGANGPAAAAPQLARAARRAGADELLEGALYRLESGELRLDVQRVDVATGAVRGAFSAQGDDLFEVADEITARMAADLGLPPRVGAARVLSSRSLVAYRFYVQGLAEYYRGEPQTAYALFLSAVTEDPTFAMAHYYASLSTLGDWRRSADHLGRAADLARASPEHERLLIQSAWAGRRGDPAELAIAETLAIRYPGDPDGQLRYGHALLWDGDFAGAVPHFRRVIALDSAAPAGDLPRCLACDGFVELATTYTFMDSLAAAERVTREYLRFDTASATPWKVLANVLASHGRFEEALAAEHQAASLIGEESPFFVADLAIRSGRFDDVEMILRSHVRYGRAAYREEGYWWLAISRRNEGRLQDALAAMLDLRAASSDSGVQMAAAQHQAQILLEMGRARAAAALLDSIAHPHSKGRWPGQEARALVWTHTLLATALAAAGDTARLAGIADTIARVSVHSAYGRDRRLQHHVRGLLFAARGDGQSAFAAFRRSIFSPTAGYTRTNLDAGRLLLRLGRPRQAIDLLRPALHGGLEASNLYATHAELHEALAHAFAAAGMPDSAAVHARWLIRAWHHADPQFAGRVTAMRRLAQP